MSIRFSAGAKNKRYKFDFTIVTYLNVTTCNISHVKKLYFTFLSDINSVSNTYCKNQITIIRYFNWCVWGSQLCQKLNLPPPKELYRPTVFKHWRSFSVLNYRQAVWLRYGGCSFVCRSLRITGLLSTPLVLRIRDWLCILPAITLVFWQVQES